MHDVENQYLSWLATNIQDAEGKHPQIVSAVEAKLQDYKKYKSLDLLMSKRGIKKDSQMQPINTGKGSQAKTSTVPPEICTIKKSPTYGY